MQYLECNSCTVSEGYCGTRTWCQGLQMPNVHCQKLDKKAVSAILGCCGTESGLRITFLS